MEQQEAKPRRIYRGIKSIRRRLDGAAVSTVYAWMANAGFPRPFKLANGHSNAWDAEAVDNWIEQQFTKGQRDSGASQ